MNWSEIIDLSSKIVPVLAVLVGAATWLWRKYHQLRLVREDNLRLRKELRAIRQELGNEHAKVARLTQAEIDFRNLPLTDRLTKNDKRSLQQHVKYLLQKQQAEHRAQLDPLKVEAETYRSTSQSQSRQLAEAESTIAALRAEAAERQRELQVLSEEATRNQNRIAALTEELARIDVSVSTADARMWHRPPAAETFPFRPLKERGYPIISILNLKGGVGKTTITSNLGAIFDRQGKSALLVDTDYQRSLTMMLLNTDQRRLAHAEAGCLQHYLHDVWSQASVNGSFNKYFRGVPYGNGRCFVMPNSDLPHEHTETPALEDAENRLMAHWLIQRNGAAPDVRCLLRKVLHDPLLQGRFDYVLIDCPPRLTTACVNALFASDYLLVPFLPDDTSTRTIKNLLDRLHELRPVANPKLRILGLAPNRISLRQGEPTEVEKETIKDLRYAIQGYKSDFPAKVLDQVYLPDSSAFAKASRGLNATPSKLSLAIEDERVRLAFEILAAAIQKEVDSDANAHAVPH